MKMMISILPLLSWQLSADIKKLKAGGYNTVKSLQMATKKTLLSVKGISEAKVEKIKEAIDRLVNDKKLYQQLQQNCIKAREELCWETQEEKLVNLYVTI